MGVIKIGKIKVFKKMEIKRLELIVFVFVTAFLMGCNSPVPEKTYEDVKSLTDDIRKNITFISQKDFYEKLKSDEKFNLLDCREEEEYNAACIPGAINIPRGIVEFNIGHTIPKRQWPLYVYSDSEEKSILVANSLKLIKYSSVIVIQGNWEQWKTQFPDAVQLEPNAEQINDDTTPAEEEDGGCGG